jgi:Cdc6-like AAA superfamily ATPase
VELPVNNIITKGTGKSALVNEVIREFKGDSSFVDKYSTVLLNCMNILSAKLVYQHLCKDLDIWKGESADECIAILEALFLPAAKTKKVKSKAPSANKML